jgi:NitT/TauT family transport system substrate-binding protein
MAFLLALAPITALAAERLVICYAAAASALVQLAKPKDFYAAEGLDVELRKFSGGSQALKAMFAGECALATVAEVPVAHASLSRNDFLIIAAISIGNNFERMIVRSDRGIRAAADLRGRRIAVPEFTAQHYFLDMYLTANGLTPKDITKVYLPHQDLAPAFRRGEVDAIVHAEPNIQMLADEFGVKAKVFSLPGLHVSPYLLICGRDTVRKNPAIVERVLRALLRAERFAKEQPANAKALVARNYALGQKEIDLLWPLQTFNLSLDQSLLFALENAARWDIGLIPPAHRPAMPNYLDFIDFDGLKAVKPAAVTIIH